MNGTRVVKLIKEHFSRGNYGQEIVEKTLTKVYGELSSVTRQEWGTAGQRGVEASFRLDVYTFEYHGERIVEIDGVQYFVYRTYINVGNDRTELYLESRGGVTYGDEEVDEVDVPAYVNIFNVLSSTGIPTFYGHASEGQTLPYIVYELDSSNFDADNKVYSLGYELTARLYTARKSLKNERKIEQAFEENDISWERGETDDYDEHEFIQEYTAALLGGD